MGERDETRGQGLRQGQAELGGSRVSRSRACRSRHRPDPRTPPTFHDELARSSSPLDQPAGPQPPSSVPFGTVVEGVPPQHTSKGRTSWCWSILWSGKDSDQEPQVGRIGDIRGDRRRHHSRIFVGPQGKRGMARKTYSYCILTQPASLRHPSHLVGDVQDQLLNELRALGQVMVPHLWANHREERVSLLYCIFPGSLGLVMWKEPLPMKPGDLGLMDSFTDNV